MTDNEMVTLDEMGDIKEDMLKLEKEAVRNERLTRIFTWNMM